MSHLCFFCLHIGAGDLGYSRLAGNSFNDAYSGTLKLPHFFRIVGKQANPGGAEFLQDFGGKVVVARIRGKSQRFVRFRRVLPAAGITKSPKERGRFVEEKVPVAPGNRSAAKSARLR